MHAEAKYGEQGSKFGKIAIVTGFHVLAAIALINMKMVVTTPPHGETTVRPIPLPTPTPPDPVVQDFPTKEKPLPDMLVPKTEVIIAEPIPDKLVSHLLDKKAVIDPPPPGVAGSDDGKVGGSGGGTVEAKKEKVFTAALANAKDCALPSYPVSAARNGYAGTVSLALLIGTNGEVTDSRVQKSSGYRELDRAAIAALQMCKFKPATSNGVAEPAWGQIAYVWRLD